MNLRKAHNITLTLARLHERVALGEPLVALLNELLCVVEQMTPGVRCSIQLADSSTGILETCAAPSLPAEFTLAIDRIPISNEVASCGKVAAGRRSVIVTKIDQSLLWRGSADLAKRYQLAASWWMPLVDSSGQLLGTCAMHSSEPRGPAPREKDWLRIAAALATTAIRRHRDTERLRVSEARYCQLAETCFDAVIIHSDGRIVYANPAATQLLSLKDPKALIAQKIERIVTLECEVDLYPHRTGPLAASLRCEDDGAVNVEIMASKMPAAGGPLTLLVCRDITDRQRLESELLEVSSHEQAHLAHDLHDGLGQDLTGIALLLRGLGNEIIRELPAYAESFSRVNALVLKSIEDTRRLASGMSLIAVERLGLGEALIALGARVEALHGLQVSLEIEPLFHTSIEDSVASHLYRIAQEAVSNVARHAHATRLEIIARLVDSELHLQIDDDGIGIAESSQTMDGATGLGLQIMRYRARGIGGSFRIDRRQPNGTTVRVSFPLIKNDEPKDLWHSRGSGCRSPGSR